MDWDAFFTVHRDMPRQGPGCAEDVEWALKVAGVSGKARVVDAGCGPGADLLTLATLLPEARITGIDATAHLADEARKAVALLDNVDVVTGDMARLDAPVDFIWCAGALYFLGIEAGLRGWAPALAPMGHVAFSDPVLITAKTGDVAAFWEEYPQITDWQGIEDRVAAAGWQVKDKRLIIGAPWQHYYDPMEARIAKLRVGTPDAPLQEALDAAAREAALWRANQDAIAYMLVVAEPAR